MGKSDVDQIIEWKGRRGHSRLGVELVFEVERLQRLWISRAELAPEFFDFIPMRLVTIIEVFVREVIREIVDHGQPYLERSEKLVRGAKIDFIFASTLQGQKLSIGDLVAHTISINNPTQIIASFEGLIPDFIKHLKISHSRWSEDAADWPFPPIIGNYNKTIANLSRLFEVRHIVTHELPSQESYDADEIDGFLTASEEFLNATDWLVVETLKGHIPRTQMEMNLQAGGTMEKLEAEMGELLGAIGRENTVDSELLRQSQEAWAAYAKREADLRASLVQGGSMYPMVWASAKSEVIGQRIDALRWWLDRDEGDR
ncbi:lysozyme inhibitor LprI family protein [Mesorhizobium sp. PL10]